MHGACLALLLAILLAGPCARASRHAPNSSWPDAPYWVMALGNGAPDQLPDQLPDQADLGKGALSEALSKGGLSDALGKGALSEALSKGGLQAALGKGKAAPGSPPAAPAAPAAAPPLSVLAVRGEGGWHSFNLATGRPTGAPVIATGGRAWSASSIQAAPGQPGKLFMPTAYGGDDSLRNFRGMIQVFNRSGSSAMGRFDKAHPAFVLRRPYDIVWIEGSPKEEDLEADGGEGDNEGGSSDDGEGGGEGGEGGEGGGGGGGGERRQQLVVAAQGNDALAVYDAETGQLDSILARGDYTTASMQGPRGLALDGPGRTLYVTTQGSSADATDITYPTHLRSALLAVSLDTGDVRLLDAPAASRSSLRPSAAASDDGAGADADADSDVDAGASDKSGKQAGKSGKHADKSWKQAGKSATPAPKSPPKPKPAGPAARPQPGGGAAPVAAKAASSALQPRPSAPPAARQGADAAAGPAGKSQDKKKKSKKKKKKKGKKGKSCARPCRTCSSPGLPVRLWGIDWVPAGSLGATSGGDEQLLVVSDTAGKVRWYSPSTGKVLKTASVGQTSVKDPKTGRPVVLRFGELRAHGGFIYIAAHDPTKDGPQGSRHPGFVFRLTAAGEPAGRGGAAKGEEALWIGPDPELRRASGLALL